MRTSPALLAVIVMTCTDAAMANQELARKNNCLVCHKIDQAYAGPAYRDIARRYAGDKAAETKLIDKVKKGGVGVWGKVPMPPNSTVKDADIKVLVRWILAGAR